MLTLASQTHRLLVSGFSFGFFWVGSSYLVRWVSLLAKIHHPHSLIRSFLFVTANFSGSVFLLFGSDLLLPFRFSVARSRVFLLVSRGEKILHNLIERDFGQKCPLGFSPPPLSFMSRRRYSSGPQYTDHGKTPCRSHFLFQALGWRFPPIPSELGFVTVRLLHIIHHSFIRRGSPFPYHPPRLPCRLPLLPLLSSQRDVILLLSLMDFLLRSELVSHLPVLLSPPMFPQQCDFVFHLDSFRDGNPCPFRKSLGWVVIHPVILSQALFSLLSSSLPMFSLNRLTDFLF